MMTNEQNDALITALKNVVAAIEALSAKIEKVEVKVESVGQAVAANGFETRTALNAILDLVGKNNELLRSECAAREELARRREKHAEVMRKSRERVTSQTITEKEKKKEKEPSPHTPYKEEKEDKVKEPLHARAREEDSISVSDGAENVDDVAENPEKPNEDAPKKKKRGKKPFKKPTEEEVAAYIKEKGFHFDAHTFWSFYESKGWMVGSNKMTKWRSACDTFEARKNRKPATTSRPIPKNSTPGVVLHMETESTLRKMGGLF